MTQSSIVRGRGGLLRISNAALFVLTSLAAVFVSADTFAATRVTNTFGGWAVTCVDNGGTSTCVMTQSLRQARSKRPRAAWMIARNEKKQVVNRIVVPTGVSLKEGLEIYLNGKPMKVPYVACTPRECGAVFLMDDAVEKALNAEKPISVQIVTANGKTFALRFDAKSFPSAYADFNKQPAAEKPNPSH